MRVRFFFLPWVMGWAGKVTPGEGEDLKLPNKKLSILERTYFSAIVIFYAEGCGTAIYGNTKITFFCKFHTRVRACILFSPPCARNDIICAEKEEEEEDSGKGNFGSVGMGVSLWRCWDNGRKGVLCGSQEEKNSFSPFFFFKKRNQRGNCLRLFGPRLFFELNICIMQYYMTQRKKATPV